MKTLDIRCINPECSMHGEIINTISGIPDDEYEYMFEQWYSLFEEADFCATCGELGEPDEYS